MCRTLVPAVFFAVALGLTPAHASTQEATSAEVDLARYEALLERIESEDRRISEGRAALLERERRESEGRLDTLAVGPLTVITWEDRADEVEALVSQTWHEDFEPLRNTWVDEALSEEPLVVDLADRTRSPGSYTYRLAVAPGDASAETRADVSRTISRMLLDRMPGPLRSWLRGANALSPPRSRRLYRRMVLTGGEQVQRCAVGEVVSCRALLALDAPIPPDQRVRLWFDGEGARTRVELLGDRSNSVISSEEYFHCSRLNDAESCYGMLARLDNHLTLPFEGELRVHLLWFALDRGDRSALARLVAAQDAQAEEALEAAADLEMDALLEEWTTTLRHAGRPNESPERRRERGAALAWVTVFAFLSMTNTRWRLGR